MCAWWLPGTYRWYPTVCKATVVDSYFGTYRRYNRVFPGGSEVPGVPASNQSGRGQNSAHQGVPGRCWDAQV